MTNIDILIQAANETGKPSLNEGIIYARAFRLRAMELGYNGYIGPALEFYKTWCFEKQTSRELFREIQLRKW